MSPGIKNFFSEFNYLVPLLRKVLKIVGPMKGVIPTPSIAGKKYQTPDTQNSPDTHRRNLKVWWWWGGGFMQLVLKYF